MADKMPEFQAAKERALRDYTVAALFVLVVIWLVTLLGPSDWRGRLEAAGDAVASVAAGASVVALFFAVAQLRLQREAMEEQRVELERQMAEQREANSLQQSALAEQLDMQRQAQVDAVARLRHDAGVRTLREIADGYGGWFSLVRRHFRGYYDAALDGQTLAMPSELVAQLEGVEARQRFIETDRKRISVLRVCGGIALAHLRDPEDAERSTRVQRFSAHLAERLDHSSVSDYTKASSDLIRPPDDDEVLLGRLSRAGRAVPREALASSRARLGHAFEACRLLDLVELTLRDSLQRERAGLPESGADLGEHERTLDSPDDAGTPT